MTVTLEFLPKPARIDRRAFLIAALATPFVVGIGGIPFILPPFAAVLGLPAYLLLGVPLFWPALRHLSAMSGHAGPLMLAATGLVANLGTYPLYLGGMSAAGAAPASARNFAEFCFLFGIVFAPLFGLVFGALYAWLARPGRFRERLRGALVTP